MSYRVKVKSASFRRVRHTGKAYARIGGAEIADALGAEVLARIPQVGGAPYSIHALRSQLAARLFSTGGRPALQGAKRRQKIPLTAQDWRTLNRLAERLSTREKRVTAGQVASALVHEGLGLIK